MVMTLFSLLFIAVVAVGVTLTASQDHSTRNSARAAGAHWVVYDRALVRYAATHTVGNYGTIPASALVLPAGYQIGASYGNRVRQGVIYAYADLTPGAIGYAASLSGEYKFVGTLVKSPGWSVVLMGAGGGGSAVAAWGILSPLYGIVAPCLYFYLPQMHEGLAIFATKNPGQALGCQHRPATPPVMRPGPPTTIYRPTPAAVSRSTAPSSVRWDGKG